MPELPEVETVRRGVASHVVGRYVADVEVGRERVVRRTSRQALIDGLRHTTITGTARRGKYLTLSLDSGDRVMVHLRMSGQLLIAEPGAERPPHTHVVVHLAAAPTPGAVVKELWFVDPRTFGEMVVFDPDNAAIELPEYHRLGVDPIADEFPRSLFGSLLAGRRRQIKALLLDQHVIAGLGNIYTDECLHLARIHPFRTADTLTGAQVTRLHEAIGNVLAEAIESGGSSLGDGQYVNMMGELGSYQNDHGAYGRTGLPCLRCGKGSIKRVMVNGRSTHFCPTCQRL